MGSNGKISEEYMQYDRNIRENIWLIDYAEEYQGKKYDSNMIDWGKLMGNLWENDLLMGKYQRMMIE